MKKSQPGQALAIELQNILKQYWGYASFRPLQKEIITSVLSGHDTLALMPTGGGKSLCFQVPALAQEGLCLVITPLIALMKDQVESLKSKGIKAEAIYSGLSRREIDLILDNCIYGKIKFLYVSPERLETELFRERAKKMNVNLLAVDEAHCISEWGYDFRPSYLNIAEIRSLIKNVPVLALTATATATVRKDIKEKLHFQNEKEFQKSFDRPNLIYGVIHDEDKRNRLIKILDKVPGSAIVYVKNRRTTKEIASFLQWKKISASYYHGGLDSGERMKKQESWKNGSTRVMVSTNAFGMGIDKPDVRVVAHLNLPESLEAYYQEAGRAGRDGARSFALALVDPTDQADLLDRLNAHFPSVKEIKSIYHFLGSYFQIPFGSGINQEFDFDIKAFHLKYQFAPFKIYNVIRILEQEGYLATTDALFLPSRIRIKMNYQDLYHFQVEQKHFEPLIKLLLRTYEHLFEHFQKIREKELAKKLNQRESKIIKNLKKLHKLEVVEYFPRKNAPQLIFLKPRLDKEHLKLEHQHLKKRKDIYEKKIKAVLRYAFEHYGCRSRELLSYFDERTTGNCGHCDYCLKLNRKNLKEHEFNRIYSKILDLLNKESLAINQLNEALNHYNEEKIQVVLRWLVDNDQVKIENQKLRLKT